LFISLCSLGTNHTSPAQRWTFISPGLFPSEKAQFFARSTLSALVNEAASTAPGSTINGTNLTASGLTLLPETESRYGVNHVGSAALQYPDVEVACKTRDCNQYAPSQMWYVFHTWIHAHYFCICFLLTPSIISSIFALVRFSNNIFVSLSSGI
jgi:hypothetical protein